MFDRREGMTFGLSYWEVQKVKGSRNSIVSISYKNMHTVSARWTKKGNLHSEDAT